MVFEVRSTLIIAILFAVSGSNVASSNNCNTTRRLAYSIFGNSDAVHNTSIAGMLNFKNVSLGKPCRELQCLPHAEEIFNKNISYNDRLCSNPISSVKEFSQLCQSPNQ